MNTYLFSVENGLSLNVDLGLDWAWNLRGFDGCFRNQFHQKRPYILVIHV